MIKDIKLPELSENVTSADVVKVLVKVGDVVKVDQSLFELETDKAVFEMPSSEAGTVVEILAEKGGSVKRGPGGGTRGILRRGGRCCPHAAAEKKANAAPSAPPSRQAAAPPPAVSVAPPPPPPLPAPPPSVPKAAPSPNRRKRTLAAASSFRPCGGLALRACGALGAPPGPGAGGGPHEGHGHGTAEPHLGGRREDPRQARHGGGPARVGGSGSREGPPRLHALRSREAGAHEQGAADHRRGHGPRLGHRPAGDPVRQGRHHRPGGLPVPPRQEGGGRRGQAHHDGHPGQGRGGGPQGLPPAQRQRGRGAVARWSSRSTSTWASPWTRTGASSCPWYGTRTARTSRALSVEIAALAEKARTKRITPEEMEGGTFTISNLGRHRRGGLLPHRLLAPGGHPRACRGPRPSPCGKTASSSPA